VWDYDGILYTNSIIESEIKGIVNEILSNTARRVKSASNLDLAGA
jgi:hypothetical protein